MTLRNGGYSMRSWKSYTGRENNTCVLLLLHPPFALQAFLVFFCLALRQGLTSPLRRQGWKPPPAAPTTSSTNVVGQASSRSPPVSSSQTQTPPIPQFNMMAAAAAARNFGYQPQFQPMGLGVAPMNAPTAGYFAPLDMSQFGGPGPGAGRTGWSRR
jgi:hypothetical protein